MLSYSYSLTLIQTNSDRLKLSFLINIQYYLFLIRIDIYYKTQNYHNTKSLHLLTKFKLIIDL